MLVDEAYHAADQGGLDKNARQALKVRVDGRLMSLETLLATVKFHAHQEYPNLLGHGTAQDILNTLYATNINDQYWISRLVEGDAVQNLLLRTALNRLSTHLAQIPPSA